MENENKERIILNDEELKEVVGGKESDKDFSHPSKLAELTAPIKLRINFINNNLV